MLQNLISVGFYKLKDLSFIRGGEGWCKGGGIIYYLGGTGISLGDNLAIFIGFSASFSDKRSLPGGPV